MTDVQVMANRVSSLLSIGKTFYEAVTQVLADYCIPWNQRKEFRVKIGAILGARPKKRRKKKASTFEMLADAVETGMKEGRNFYEASYMVLSANYIPKENWGEYRQKIGSILGRRPKKKKFHPRQKDLFEGN